MKKLRNIRIFLFLLVLTSCNQRDSVAPSPKLETIISAKKSNKKPSKYRYKQCNITNLVFTAANQHTGKMLYVVPKEMEVRKTYQIIVRVSNSCVNIYENIDTTNKVSFTPTTDAMQVKLVDPSPADSKVFSIIDDNDAIQLVDSTDSYTEWSWDVTPLKAGKVEVRAVVSNITDGELKETIYTENVSIKLNILKQLLFWINTYWQWLVATLLAPLAKFGYDAYSKKTKSKKHEKSS